MRVVEHEEGRPVGLGTASSRKEPGHELTPENTPAGVVLAIPTPVDVTVSLRGGAS